MTYQLEIQSEKQVSEMDASLPVCLAPWIENPYRLVTLWDIVIQFSGESLFGMGTALELLKVDCFFAPGGQKGLGNLPLPVQYHKGPIDDEVAVKGIEWLASLRD